MATMYEITGDIRNIYVLVDSLVDENGEPREPTEDELETMKQWMAESVEDFKIKFDNCCRLIKNLRLSAKNAEAEKQNLKDEINRLTRRHKAMDNRARSVNGLLRFCMERLELKKYKSDLFTANIQNVGGKSISVLDGLTAEDMSRIPERYLKPREVDKEAVLNDLKDGILEEREGQQNLTKVFFKNGDVLPFVHVHQSDALVIR